MSENERHFFFFLGFSSREIRTTILKTFNLFLDKYLFVRFIKGNHCMITYMINYLRKVYNLW